MTEGELAAAFEAGTLRGVDFPHREHVRLAWHYVRRHPLPEALAAYCRGLRRFAAAQGVPEKYHETITLAYLLLIHERAQRMDPDHTWDDFARTQTDVLDRGRAVLLAYYREDTLRSDFARRVFVLPDRGKDG